MSEDIHRTNPPINAMDFGVPPLFAERAENYARWAVQAERKALVVLVYEMDGPDGIVPTDDLLAAIRARGQS